MHNPPPVDNAVSAASPSIQYTGRMHFDATISVCCISYRLRHKSCTYSACLHGHLSVLGPWLPLGDPLVAGLPDLLVPPLLPLGLQAVEPPLVAPLQLRVRHQLLRERLLPLLASQPSCGSAQ